MVSGSDGPTYRLPLDSTNNRQSTCTTGLQNAASSQEIDCVDGVSCLRQQYTKRGLSGKASSILLASWKPGTKKQYATFYSRWFRFCRQRPCDPFSTSIETVIEFLASLFENDLGYSAINTARGALSSLGLSFDGFAAGSHPLVVRFLKGVYCLRPSQPRYTHTWDASVVLKFLMTLSPLESLSLKLLSFKLVMLIALTSASRVQGIKYLKVSNMKKFENDMYYHFHYTDMLKTSRPNFNQEIVLRAYTLDKSLCVYSVLEEYLKRTEALRKSDFLLISYVKPHDDVSTDTVARWIRTVMTLAGVDTNVFKAHSVRSASVSKAKSCNIPIDDILHQAGWSKKETFKTYYDKPVLQSTCNMFSDAVLKV